MHRIETIRESKAYLYLQKINFISKEIKLKHPTIVPGKINLSFSCRVTYGGMFPGRWRWHWSKEKVFASQGGLHNKNSADKNLKITFWLASCYTPRFSAVNEPQVCFKSYPVTRVLRHHWRCYTANCDLLHVELFWTILWPFKFYGTFKSAFVFI